MCPECKGRVVPKSFDSTETHGLDAGPFERVHDEGYQCTECGIVLTEKEVEMPEVQEYVVGFLFNEAKTHVALIRKNRPQWQAGKFNGIGGHVEPGEGADSAMRREFREETGVDIGCWERFLSLTYPKARIHFYRAFNDVVFSAWTTTDEVVIVHQLSQHRISPLAVEIRLPYRVIPNLAWIIPMALSMDTDPATMFHAEAVA